ncbi:MAG: amidohydrolase [Nevskiaceae bacterium]
MTPYRCLALAALLAGLAPAAFAAESLTEQIDRLADKLEPKAVQHRRYLHQHPELSNREVETAKYVAKHLRNVGIEVRTGVARTGVIGILRGGKPGPVVALRADMDALPVTEENDLPFRSKVRTTYDGKDVGVMHACAHDAHTGMLLVTAEIIAKLKDQWPGTVKFIFQPAEESPPLGEEGGAQLMVKEGVLKSEPKPDVIFGQHVLSGWAAGEVGVRAGAMLASADDVEITVQGKGSHGAAPWLGVDPIVVASQIVLGLQTIASRQMEVTKAPVIVTIGKIEGGTRNNIIPDSVSMKGTLRALDPAMRKQLHERVRRTAEDIARSAGATATVEIGRHNSYPVTANDAALTARMMATLERVAGPGKLLQVSPILGGEDFSFFAQEIPAVYLFLGGRPPAEPAATWPSNHSPLFRIDESVLKLGTRTLAHMAADYAQGATDSQR